MSDQNSSHFTDSKSKTWHLQLSGPTVRQIQQATTLNLVDLKSDPFEILATNPLMLFDLLWLLCQKQANEAGISAEEFGERLAPHIDDATAALEEAVTNFFHGSKRSLLRSLRSTRETMTRNATMTAMATLETNQPQIEAAMARRMQRELTKLLESFDSADAETLAFAT